MEIGLWLKLVLQTGEAGDETCNPGLHGKWFIDYTTVTPHYNIF